MSLSDNEKKDASIRQQLRSDLAMALEHMPRDKLREINIQCVSQAPRNQHFHPFRAQASTTNRFDELSVALNTLSQKPKLRKIILQGPMSTSLDLFSLPASSNAWLKVERPGGLTLQLSMNTLDGEWYFDRDPNAADNEGEADSDNDGPPDFDNGDGPSLADDSDTDAHSFNKRAYERQTGDYPTSHFRTYPVTSRISPLLKAFVTAIAHMPALKRACLEADMPGRQSYFTILFLISGEEHRLDNVKHSALSITEMRRRPRRYFMTGSWRGDEDQDAFENIIGIFRTLRMVPSLEDLLVKFFETWDCSAF